MAKRYRIILQYSYNDGWIAGSYYILNLIEALKLLPDSEKPQITLLYNSKDGIELVEKIAYPYLTFKFEKSAYSSIAIRVVNKAFRTVFKTNLFDPRPKNSDTDLVFPAHYYYHLDLLNNKKKLFWIPDFQEHFLPQFFTQEEVDGRKAHQQKLVDMPAQIVFSSQSAQSDFFNLYPKAKNKTFVMQFAVNHSADYLRIDIDRLCEKFNLPEKYFFCANQFWAHKNHITLLKAIALLKKNGNPIVVAFSGKQSDYRNPGFFEELQNFVLQNNIQDNVRFLGFIDRNDQLALMKHSQAVVQPSLFEGWSTVVEDVKAMNQSLILSDIPVHREQISRNVDFFEPENAAQLAEILENYKPKSEISDYKTNITKFGETFRNILEQIKGFEYEKKT